MTDKRDNSVFNTLAGVSVGNKVRQKGKFFYVSWANAVRELLKRYPDASWEFTSYGEHGLPYLETKAGFFVECAVTVDGITRKQMMPVLDHSNKPLTSPNAAQINKSHQRALAKAIALHGFGLELWAGEDLDEAEEAQAVDVINDEQLDRLEPYIQDEAIKARIVKAYGIGTIEELPASKFAEVLKGCQKAAEKATKQ